MAFRGYFALNGVEIANSSRVAAHIGADIPTSDLGLLTPEADCGIDPIAPGRLVGNVPPSSVPIEAGRLVGTPPDGSRLYGPGTALVGDCWDTSTLCFGCRTAIEYDDSWTGLSDMLGDSIYRPELAPWYTSRTPESAEFGGVWVMDVKGLDTTPTQREVTEMAGDGGAAGPARNPSRKVTFDALLIACTNAGLTYGLQWLTTQLRSTEGRTDSTLRYLAAHPEHSAADPATLVREVHGVVMTQEPQITDAKNAGRGEHHQATMYRVSFELTVTRPHAYAPPITLAVEWDSVDVTPIKWVHAADCAPAAICEDMPALFSETCEVERIEVVNTPPPTCGGCMPVCAVDTYTFEVPTFAQPFRSRETVTTMVVRNTGAHPLTLQLWWRRCNALESCDDRLFPLQVSGLPANAELVLDGVSGRYWVNHQARKWRPFHIVGTPSGAPWRPAIIDRSLCWELVAVADGNSPFQIDMALIDREA
ncbi:minor tail protein [Mycobacterium phage Funsized]|nr:minor tail protein [Mycobacterium phage Funsized]